MSDEQFPSTIDEIGEVRKQAALKGFDTGVAATLESITRAFSAIPESQFTRDGIMQALEDFGRLAEVGIYGKDEHGTLTYEQAAREAGTSDV